MKPPSPPSSGLPAFTALLQREIVRFLRQPSRIVAAIGTAALFWLVLGSGFAGSFQMTADATATTPGGEGDGGVSYSAYLIPGMAAMVVLFASIVAAISLIDDRHAGFLQGVLVSPAPAWAMVGAKVGGCAVLALAQGMLVLLAAPLAGVPLDPLGVLLAAAALACIALGIAGIGLALAWKIDSVQGFHGVMNLVLMPMWLLSGAFFPVDSAAGWLGWVMRLNPLTWPTEALRAALLHDAPPSPAAWLGSAAFAAAGAILPWLVVRRASGQ